MRDRRNCLFALTLLLSTVLLAAACGPEVPAPTPVATPTVAPPTATVVPTTPPTPTTPAGQLLDVGGFKLFILCEGTGSPPVILDGGLGVSSYSWYAVQPAVAQFTMVCTYDRAWTGQSGVGPMPRNAEEIAKELHALVHNAGLHGPYVLAGQSFAGLYMQLYAAENPSDVAGLVMVDSIHPDLDARIEAILTPEQIKERRSDLELNEDKIRFADILESDAQVKAAGKLPDVPLIVLRHGVPFQFSPGWPADRIEKLWTELENDIASKTTHSRVIVAEKAGHRIQVDQPQIVVDAIKDVVQQVRGK